MLSKTAEYALRVAVCLAQSPDKLAAADELGDLSRSPGVKIRDSRLS